MKKLIFILALMLSPLILFGQHRYLKNVTVTDSIFVTKLATSDVKVLSPTSTGGTTVRETADVSEITIDSLDVNKVVANTYIRGATSLWWVARSAPTVNAATGASGATLVVPNANSLGGYQLNAVGEQIYFSKSIESIWDGASDLEFKVTWEVNEAASSDGTVDLQLICYYKGDHETVNKTQTLEVAHTITGNKAQYTRHTTTFTVNWDETDNVVEAADKMSFILNLETDTSECDDVIINIIMFRFKTNKIRTEV